MRIIARTTKLKTGLLDGLEKLGVGIVIEGMLHEKSWVQSIYIIRMMPEIINTLFHATRFIKKSLNENLT